MSENVRDEPKKPLTKLYRTVINRTYWCIAAGDDLRDYFKELLRFEIMLVGPRDRGKHDDNPEAYVKKPRVQK